MFRSQGEAWGDGGGLGWGGRTAVGCIVPVLGCFVMGVGAWPTALFALGSSQFSPFLCCGKDAANTQGGRKNKFLKGRAVCEGHREHPGRAARWKLLVFWEMPKLIQHRESQLMKQVAVSSLA